MPGHVFCVGLWAGAGGNGHAWASDAGRRPRGTAACVPSPTRLPLDALHDSVGSVAYTVIQGLRRRRTRLGRGSGERVRRGGAQGGRAPAGCAVQGGRAAGAKLQR